MGEKKLHNALNAREKHKLEQWLLDKWNEFESKGMTIDDETLLEEFAKARILARKVVIGNIIGARKRLKLLHQRKQVNGLEVLRGPLTANPYPTTVPMPGNLAAVGALLEQAGRLLQGK